MQKLIFASLALVGTAGAQIPMPAFTSTYTYVDSRGFSFRAPTTFRITQLNVPNEASQPQQCVEVALFPSAPNGSTMTTTRLFLAQNVPANTPIPCNILINQGDEVLIHGGASNYPASGNLHKSYGSGGGTFQTDILGHPTTIYRAGSQGPSMTGPGPYPAFGGTNGSVARVEVWVAAAAGFATKINFGTGCYATPDVSPYELFAAGTHDLSNSSISLVHNGTGYQAIGGSVALHPTTNATVLALGEDTEVTVALGNGSIPYGRNGQATALTVCSNGFVSVATGNGTGWTPNVATFLQAPQTGWWVWHDYSPNLAGSGQVKWKETTSHVYVTWDGVWSFGTSGPGSTTQLQFEKATGTVHYVFGSIDNLGNGHLVGFSEGGASANWGSLDFSTALPLAPAAFSIPALSLNGNARPTIPSTVTLTVGDVPATALFNAVIYGLARYDPGISMAAIGAPGCRQHASMDAVAILAAGPSASHSLQVPSVTALAGLHIFCQGASYVPGVNARNLITSNGVDLGIDVN